MARNDIVVGTGADPAVADTIVELLTLGLSAWTEHDADRRRKILADCCAPDVVYVSPLGAATGLDQFTDLIGVGQRSYPGYRPVRTTAIDLHHRHARLEWAFRDSAGGPLLPGSTSSSSATSP
ncbi:nuclear transport factor 2 family protein [Frankia sp. AgB1.9]|uniref:nuclear transport factor 2 family protein n=1 Tax=unclassified Frankia TaxID=2632575 RepID=UPI0019334C1A|nr:MULTISPECIES: nuclear transport factor 2 family protein [unclassified Frankia]MBL7490691.1 nuclear transport factor 2 family protein [Frankia sp. AgW1.1]MBL7547505.1 nuclear transport factor 2 family protein [Frankia sp. AgB1.9]MBL7619016.1 nuclear transport factor 2 family protein [Frankia sp. AgB1.8]